MPIYEYACEKCGKTFEEFQPITSAPLNACKLCGARKVRRLVSSTSFILKGSGWYVTDYSRKDSGGGSNGNGNGKSHKKKDEAATTAETSPAAPKDGAASGAKSAESTTPQTAGST